MTQPLTFIDTLDDITDSYAAILSDVWGVMHNGEEAFPEAVAALARAKAAGKAVVMITNSPRRNIDVEGQLRALGIEGDSYDRIVTSGDVTRELIRQAPRRIFHLGPSRDISLFEGLDVELVEEFEADAVVCTGLFEDEIETPEDYAELLQRLRSRDKPFICANPDIVVERGDRLIWCAGALARDYGLLGGRTLVAGKPHGPIYDASLRAAAEVLGRPVERAEVLAIGDGMITDVKGAADHGIDVLYVSGGIHAKEYGEGEIPDAGRLAVYLAHHGRKPVAVIPRLR
jgi:HAD superfamily hydrolase (TIGR01459 family)